MPSEMATDGPYIDEIAALVSAGVGIDVESPYAGAVVQVTHRGTVIHRSAHGWAEALELRPDGRIVEVERPRPMTVDTIFDLASLTKVVATTAAIMKLVDERRVGLDDPIGSILPQFDGPTSGVTVRQLLTHRSGLVWQPTWLHRDGTASVLSFLARLRPTAVGVHRYSDINFMLLGAVVEAVSGERLDVFVRERIHAPLGMTDTGYHPDQALRRRIAATSHGNPFEVEKVAGMVKDGSLQHADDVVTSVDAFRYRDYTLVGEVNDGNCWYSWDGVAGHAGLFATAADIGTFAQAILDGGGGVVSPATVDAFLEAPFDQERAHGFERNEVPALPGGFGHSGFTGTRFAFSRETGISVVLLTNRQHKRIGRPVIYPDVTPIWNRVVELSVAAVAP